MFYRAFFENAPFGLWVIDHTGQIGDCNEAFVRIIGATSREAVIGFNVLTDPRDKVFEPFIRSALAGEAAEIETVYTSTLGNRTAELRYVFQPMEHEGQRMVLGFVEDVGRRKKAERAVLQARQKLELEVDERTRALEDTVRALRQEISDRQQADALFRGVVEQSMVGIYIIQNACFCYVNPAFAHLLGYAEAEEINGRPVADLVAPEDRSLVLGNIQKRLAGEVADVRYAFRALRRDGSTCDVEVHGRTIEYRGQPAVIGVLLDITERKRYEGELCQHAYYDALTGLPNRTLFFGRLEQSLATARRNDQLLAFLFLDLDGFKQVNDSLGHAGGDAVLKTVAQRFALAIRQTDTLARLGGDEFAVVATELIFGDDVFAVAEKLLHTLTEPIVVDGRSFKLGVTIGISLFPKDAEDGESLYRAADRAMYQAKKERRGGYLMASGLSRVHSPGLDDALASRQPT